MNIEEKQRLNQIELTEFRKQKKEGVCVVCEGVPFGITRTHLLCRKHYKRTVADNKKKNLEGIDITTELPKDL